MEKSSQNEHLGLIRRRTNAPSTEYNTYKNKPLNVNIHALKGLFKEDIGTTCGFYSISSDCGELANGYFMPKNYPHDFEIYDLFTIKSINKSNTVYKAKILMENLEKNVLIEIHSYLDSEDLMLNVKKNNKYYVYHYNEDSNDINAFILDQHTALSYNAVLTQLPFIIYIIKK
jgi:hypothetical protein